MARLGKKVIAFLLILCICINISPLSAYAADDNGDDSTPWWKKVASQASSAVSDASDAANSFAESAKSYISKISLPDFKNGWNATARFFGTTYASISGQQYVTRVADSIESLQNNINSRMSSTGGTIAQKAGFVAEEWHAGTYNIDAVARGNANTAQTPKSNGLGSIDVTTGDGVNASLKYNATAEQTAREQAKNYLQKYGEYASKSNNPMSMDEWLEKNNVQIQDNSELYWSIYKDQVRVIPADQLDDAKAFLQKAIAKERLKAGGNRQTLASGYQETLENLSDRIETANGQSIPLTKEEAEAIAKAGSDNNFKPSELNRKITTASSIKGTYIAKQALKAGVSAAIIQAAVTLGPQIYEIIKYLIETGELDADQLKKTGMDGLSSAADGFLKGSVSNAIVVMCNAGILGKAYTSISPELVGAMTVLIVDAIRYGYKLSQGQISQEYYIDLMAQDLIVSVAALGSLGSASLVPLLFPGATLAIAVGSLVGSLVVSAGYPAGKEFVLAIISSSDIGMIVPIQSTSSSIKGKITCFSSKLTDSLSSMKGINTSSIKGKVIKVFDFS